MRIPDFKKLLSRIAKFIGKELIAEKAIGILSCKKIEITMFGGKAAEKIYKEHSSPHKKIPFVGAKTLGVALANIPEKPDETFKGKRFREARRKRNRARQEGFRCEKIPSIKYIDDIYAIHTSTSVRQNRPIGSNLRDMNKIRKFCEENKIIYGVLDRHDRLKAYASGVNCGEIIVLNRCIGDYDSLKFGIMFLLISEILFEFAKCRQLHGVPLWIQHNMFFARTAGARQFKKEAGFRPYRVKWLWNDQE